jgi:hypothetical protein
LKGPGCLGTLLLMRIWQDIHQHKLVNSHQLALMPAKCDQVRP